MHRIRTFISSAQKEFSKECRLLRKCTDAGSRPSEFIKADDFKTIIWRANQVADQARAVDVRVIELVKVLDKPRKRSELQQLIELKHNVTFRANYIDKAISDGYIHILHPEQLYRLADQGIK